jgi:NitT/TauT family transport system permease protein
MTVPPDEVTLAARVLSRQEASERLRRAGLLGGRALLVGVALLAWSGVSGRVVDAQFVSDPLSVARALTALAASGRLWPNLGQTVAEVLIGYLLGGVLGVAVALLVGLVPAAHRVLRPFLVAFYAIPKIALAPLIVMWFGLGLAPKVLLAAIFVFFVVFMNVVTGIFSVSPHLVATVRVMGPSSTTLLWKVTLPSTIPYLTSGLRIGIPEAMIGAVIGEFMAATRGLGYLVNAAAAQFNTTVALAAIAALVGVVVLMDGVLTLVEARWLRWRPKAALTGRA